MKYERYIEKYGYPLYVYKEKIIIDQLEKLKSTYENFDIYYSCKANPNKYILEFFAKNKLGADCASINEVEKCILCGFKKENILFSAPGKTKKDIEKAIDRCTVIADSLNEIALIDEICQKKTKIGIRINPNVNFDEKKAFETMSGKPSKFGIDEEILFKNIDKIKSYKNIEISGIHIYMGSGILDYKTILKNFEIIYEIADKLPFEIDFVDFGGGFGIDYSHEGEFLDLQKISVGISKLEKKYEHLNIKKIIESGRFLVAKAGKYITRITDIKESRGKKFYIIYGGMDGFFRPTFTGTKHKVSVLNDLKEYERATIAGHLCTPIDIMYEDAYVNRARIMDAIEIQDAGAYGKTMSLDNFISHRKAGEIYVTRDNREKS